jgi:signal transduction histidine kinase
LAFFFAYRANQQKRKINEMELEIKDGKLDELLTNQEAKALSAILKGQEEERERIAQELHDRLGGTLAALKLSLRKPGNHVAEEDMEIVNEAVKEVRSISHNLSTGLIQRYGFNQALKQLFKRMQGSDEMKYDLYLHPQIAKLGQAVGIELYRIVQELLSNTIKHANASFVSVQTNFDDNTFNLIYEDDGKGFDVKIASKGIGLENVNKRVKRLKGNLNIDSAPGRGTIVIIELNQHS